MSPAEASDLLAGGADLIDVRERDEWEKSRIPQATLRPLSEINDWYPLLPTDHTVILHCHVGQRSAMAVAALTDQVGMTNVVSLAGGIAAWATAGLEIDASSLPG